MSRAPSTHPGPHLHVPAPSTRPIPIYASSHHPRIPTPMLMVCAAARWPTTFYSPTLTGHPPSICATLRSRPLRLPVHALYHGPHVQPPSTCPSMCPGAVPTCIHASVLPHPAVASRYLIPVCVRSFSFLTCLWGRFALSCSLHTAHGLPFPNRHAQPAEYAERWQGLMVAYNGAGAGQVGKRIVSCEAEPVQMSSQMCSPCQWPHATHLSPVGICGGGCDRHLGHHGCDLAVVTVTLTIAVGWRLEETP